MLISKEKLDRILKDSKHSIIKINKENLKEGDEFEIIIEGSL